MKILGIDTSCDETSVALVEDQFTVLANQIYSQIPIHKAYGGVVPEIASRSHLKQIIPTIDATLAAADKTIDDLDAIAVTYGPGLIGCLLIGLQVAKALAYARNIRFIGVNHLEGHLMSPFLTTKKAEYPFIGLIVSGGHTSLYYCQTPGDFKLIGSTVDDAAGEAFDKVAKLLNLGYPGGVVIDRLARQGNPKQFRFPRPLLHSKTLDFSFSGLKTAVSLFIKSKTPQAVQNELDDIAASFQEAVIEVLLKKSLQACERYHCRRLLVSGGVAANSRLRAFFLEKGPEAGLTVILPELKYCTDNGAMIAAAAYPCLAQGQSSPLTINAEANIIL